MRKLILGDDGNEKLRDRGQGQATGSICCRGEEKELDGRAQGS